MLTSPRVIHFTQHAIIYGILGFGAFLILFPLAWAATSALKPNTEVFAVPMNWIPENPLWENFILPFQERPFGTYFLNSIIAALASVALTVVISCLAGFSLAKYRYFGRNIAFVAILSTMMLPVQVILVPLYLVVRDLGWLDSYQGLILPQAVNAFSIFLMRQHMKSIPDDYIEAARLDGASELSILLRVVVPMSRASISAVVIFAFLASWDSYVWPLVVVTRDALRTLPLGLSMFFSEYSSQYNQALAAAIIMMVPVLLVFIVLQRQFVEGLTRSGLK
ncbi:MAG: carbohydrate ABC transporter permease [Chloroflexi bacterium]|nr:carbohydrate ABC transporter permease [Chloroflexota bacterium]